jgi:hypothetical protein
MADVTPLRGPGIGHNLPPEPLETSFVTADPAVLQARLERQYAPLMRRFIELDLGAKKLPPKIATAAEAKKVVDWVAQQCRPLALEAKQAHDAEKKPYLVGSVVDRFFNDRIRQLTVIIGTAERKTGEYQRQQEAIQRQRKEAARQAAAEEQRRATAEYERLAREARQKEAEGQRAAAVELTKQAQEQETRAAVAEAIIQAPPEPVRVHGEYGATGFSVKKWTFDPIELDLSLLPPGYWTPDLEGIQQAIDDGERAIPGVNIKEVDRFTIRRC